MKIPGPTAARQRAGLCCVIALAMLAAQDAYAAGGILRDGTPVKDASGCVVVKSVARKKNGEDAHFKIANECTTRINVAWCRSPSAMSRSRTTECGDGKNSGYYKQFIQLEPGEESGHPDSSPADALPQYGACFGFGTLKHQKDGSYSCRGG